MSSTTTRTPSLWDHIVDFIEFLKFSFFGFYLLLVELEVGTKIKGLIPFLKSSHDAKGKLDKTSKKLTLILDETLREFHQQRQQQQQQHSSSDNNNYYAIVTGANSGIGLETTKVLVANGYNVIMACRSIDRANEAKKLIEDSLNDVTASPLADKVGKLVVMKCDLGDLDSVKKFSEEVINGGYKVNRLINNAGVMLPPFTLTKQGLEVQFGGNYLAHFYLTLLLLDTLKKNGPSRILNVSSAAHWTGSINWDNISPKSASEYNACTGYTQSKVCLIMSTYKMHRYLQEKNLGSTITVNVLHPGIIVTNITSNIWAWASFLYKYFISLIAFTPLEGAVNTLYLALSPEVEQVSGKYFVYCTPQMSNPVSYDAQQQEKLWISSLEMLKELQNFSL